MPSCVQADHRYFTIGDRPIGFSTSVVLVFDPITLQLYRPMDTQLDPENNRISYEILMLYCVQADI